MFLILWEFEVKPGYEQSFEFGYGPKAPGRSFSAAILATSEPCS
jgi:hypothetical protein